MLSKIKNIFSPSFKNINSYKILVSQINIFEEEVSKYKDSDFLKITNEFKNDLKNLSYEEQQKYLDKILPKAYAMVREAARRTVGVRHYDVQLISGIVLHKGKIAEQKTGEGKTLTATLPLYLNSLTGRGCHIVTPNDYLSRHGAGWYGDLYTFLGVSVGVIVENTSYVFDKTYTNDNFEDSYSLHFKPSTRAQSYGCDITYGTNNEFGFDYLRDNMENNFSDMVQTNPRGEFGVHNFAVVDEIDSILIDEARTPLIISTSSNKNLGDYLKYSEIVKNLNVKTDYTVDEKDRNATLTELGLNKVEKMLSIDNLYETDFEIVKQVENAIKAKALYLRDRDYVVRNGEVKIVDEFTGRILDRNRYSGGLHQAIEAKEGVTIQPESKTLATTSYQNYFRLYKKLSGMTGTAKTEEEEFYKIYGLEVVSIPTVRPVIRNDKSDIVYKTKGAKYRALVEDIRNRNLKGQPILVGTTNVETSELISNLLKKLKIPHTVLNAKHHEKEALIISQAGKKGSVTVATNMAGRGVDIILGGEPFNKKLHDEVSALGGLYVIGTERHESRRIDNQLRGRSGRQGDPGESRFYISLQDDLMRIFGGEQVERLMNRFGVDESIPISAGLVSRAIESAQKKVEGINFDRRKALVQYDDVLNIQREIIYKLRKILMQSPDFEKSHLYIGEESIKMFREDFDIWFTAKISDTAKDKYANYSKKYTTDWYSYIKVDSLNVINSLWMDHIDIMHDLRESVNLRRHGQLDPLVEYKKEGKELFEKLLMFVWGNISKRIEAVDAKEPPKEKLVEVKPKELEYKDSGDINYGVLDEAQDSIENNKTPYVNIQKVGRNDPCPCGSGKKYKHCHGKIN